MACWCGKLMQPEMSGMELEQSRFLPPERSVTLLGATGSIGASTIDLLKRQRERYRIEAVTAL